MSTKKAPGCHRRPKDYDPLEGTENVHHRC